ncbi:MAG: hypothetical protein ABJC74_08310 [Gemmatimonadota bacterium]
MNPSRHLEALAFAADRHRDQQRKGASASSYINHPIAVATMLATEGHVQGGSHDDHRFVVHDHPADELGSPPGGQPCIVTGVH